MGEIWVSFGHAHKLPDYHPILFLRKIVLLGLKTMFKHAIKIRAKTVPLISHKSVLLFAITDI